MKPEHIRVAAASPREVRFSGGIMQERFMDRYRRQEHPHRPGLAALLVLCAFLACILTACASSDRMAMSFLDTSEHHTYTGALLVKQGKYSDAEREFSLALQLNRESPVGHAGVSLVKAHRGNTQAALEHMEKAERFARRSRDRLYVYTSRIQLSTMIRRSANWIEDAEHDYGRAMAIDPRCAAAHYYMGRARMMNLEFQEAGSLFMRVLDLNDDYLEEADREWKRVKTIQESRPATRRVEEVALVDRLTRSQLALILIDHLNIDELYRGLGIYNGSGKRSAEAVDIEHHRYEREIMLVVDINVAGLELYPDLTFHPDDLVTRLSLAATMYDIMIKVSGDESLSDRYRDPFDTTETVTDTTWPHHNAVKTVVVRSIMPPEWFTSGRLAPYSPISGAEALLAIKNLKDVLLIGF